PLLGRRKTDSGIPRNKKVLSVSSPSGILKLIAILLIVLLISNVYLFFQLRSMEDQMVLSHCPLIALRRRHPLPIQTG
ncbi:unnamed protein product, partial [Darwinula stevensoni]